MYAWYSASLGASACSWGKWEWQWSCNGLRDTVREHTHVHSKPWREWPQQGKDHQSPLSEPLHIRSTSLTDRIWVQSATLWQELQRLHNSFSKSTPRSQRIETTLQPGIAWKRNTWPMTTASHLPKQIPLSWPTEGVNATTPEWLGSLHHFTFVVPSISSYQSTGTSRRKKRLYVINVYWSKDVQSNSF